MSRIIKFRAWDGQSMITDILVDSQGGWDTPEKRVNTDLRVVEFVYENIMEFTGKKDHQGKEIYEGDIITGQTDYERESDEYSWTNENPCEVYWDERASGFYPFIINSRWRCEVVNINVIGNIYENPELLK